MLSALPALPSQIQLVGAAGATAAQPSAVKLDFTGDTFGVTFTAARRSFVVSAPVPQPGGWDRVEIVEARPRPD